MTAGIRGRLISTTFAAEHLGELPGAATPSLSVIRALDAWAVRRESLLGPASSLRAIVDSAVIPLLSVLGFELRQRQDGSARTILAMAPPGGTVIVPVITVRWGEPLDRAWRDAVAAGIDANARWCLCCNGVALRIVDAHRTWTRRHVEFDLTAVNHDELARLTLWRLARAESLAVDRPLVGAAADLSARHGVAVCKTLGEGVLHALGILVQAIGARRTDRPPAVLFEESLTVLYRLLFLLFAEARGLVPIWHPLYRERYTVGAIVTNLLAQQPYRGIWDAIQAISRLAHAGCHAPGLRVTPYNGRLFSPAHSAIFDRTRLPDSVMSEAVMAVGSAAGRRGRTRIGYGDLDVEQLGAVYEQVLDYEPRTGSPALIRTGDVRRATGTFYTPRAVTAFLVKNTLEPLVSGARAEDILHLRVLDPAMGSGAFLVAACRFLAAAAEDRLVEEGRWHPGDVTAGDRAALRREIAQRCLFGVDLNPMAVQLGRLSLWLATLASGKPLTFLDHHLVAGNSLIGATFEDVLRQPTASRARRRPSPLPLFDRDNLDLVLQKTAMTRSRLALDPDDTPDDVTTKERVLKALQDPSSPLGRWSRVFDLWCSGWFWETGSPPDAQVFAALCDHLLHRHASLPARLMEGPLEQAAGIARRHHFFHWPLMFPEVFSSDGSPSRPSGFDAVVGNPPWDMVRGDSGSGRIRESRRKEAHDIANFVREAGVYRVEPRAHINRYQLFLERALQLARRGGRVGLVLPAGVMTDTGSGSLRRHLFHHAAVDSVTGLDNREGIFPIHRSLKFALVTATTGTATERMACRFGLASTDALETDSVAPHVVTRAFLRRHSGEDDLGVPEIVEALDFRIIEAIGARVPWLGAPEGWNVQFGRELHASDDRASFRPFTGRHGARPVLEGKQLEPFRTSLADCRYELNAAFTSTRLVRRPRLAYRDVASATNRLTLIAAVIPARAVSTHTLFCLRSPLDGDSQHVLCALLNSFVANYLIRRRVNTHVTVSLVSRLPVPTLDSRDPVFARLATLSRTLSRRMIPVDEMPEYAELQALTAKLYGMSESELAHILKTFPLIPQDVKERALRSFRTLA